MLYRVNAGVIPSDNWIQRAEGGGRIIGEVCHFVDALTFLSGALPVEVQAIAAKDHKDAVSALIRFSDGSTGTIVYSSLGDALVPKEYVEVFAAGRVVQLYDFVRLDATISGKRTRTKASPDKGQRALLSAFIAATRRQGPCPIPLTEIAAVSEAALAIEEAVASCCPVAVEASRSACV
jgi:polar amino acid transport system substrate-binding protein